MPAHLENAAVTTGLEEVISIKNEYSKNRLPGRKEAEVNLGSWLTLHSTITYEESTACSGAL